MSDVLGALRNGVRSRTAEETGTWAERLAPWLPTDLALCLQGPVGAGKTSFTSNLIKALGAAEPVTSPTFKLLSVYEAAGLNVLHLDAYRLGEQTSSDHLALEDLMQSLWLLIVEWPENIPSLLPPNTWWLRFEIPEENERILRLDAPDGSSPT